jgi:signal transduction histidine kinase
MNPRQDANQESSANEIQQRILLELSHQLLKLDGLNAYILSLLKLLKEIYPIELIVLQDSSKLLSLSSLKPDLVADPNPLEEILRILQMRKPKEEVSFFFLDEDPDLLLTLNDGTIQSVLLIRPDNVILSEDLFLSYISTDPTFKPIFQDYSFFKTVSNLVFFLAEKTKIDSSIQNADQVVKENLERAQREYEQRRELLRKLSVQAKTLKDKNVEIEEFVYTISHDLKAPLISIQGFTTAIKEDYSEDLPEEAQFYLDRIVKNVELIEIQIKQILEYSRIGRIVTTPKRDLNLNKVIEECLNQFATQIKKYNFSISIPSEFPLIHVEENRMMQLFINLIGNSIKYRGDNPTPRIEIGKHAADEKFVTVYVRDNGIGIPEKFQPRIFNLFARAPNTGIQEIEGTGIGLAHVKKIVETHGGKIWMESTVGVGTTMFFELPLCQSSPTS